MIAPARTWCALLCSMVILAASSCSWDEELTAVTDVSHGAASKALLGFVSSGNVTAGRFGHVAARLPDGRVLIAGGASGAVRLASGELFNPASQAWQPTGSMVFARLGHSGVTLADGRVLVVGGASANTCSDPPVGNSAEIFDPATGAWTRTGDMLTGRNSAAAVRLADGRVLVAGGGNRCGVIHRSTEIFDPGTGAWSQAGDLTVGRQAPAAVLLADGRVLLAGGFGTYPFASVASAEIFDPASGAWTPTGNMLDARVWSADDVAPANALVLLGDGRVLTAGGLNRCDLFGCVVGYLNRAELFDPATGLWSAAGAMTAARTRHQMTLLASGQVLVMGGQAAGSIVNSAERFDPATGLFENVGALLTGRFDHSATRLADGRVLIAAGQGPTGVLASAEIFAVNRAPSADAGAEIDGAEGQQVQFDGRGSADPDGQALMYAWDFGDGSPAGTDPTPTHVYADDGDYAVSLVVSDGELTATSTTQARIRNVVPVLAPLAGASLGPDGQYGASGAFADPGADSWTATVDYGDGAGMQPLTLSGKAFTLNRTYGAPGTYVVRVTVSDDDGGTGQAEAEVIVAADEPEEPGVELDPKDEIGALIDVIHQWRKERHLSSGETLYLTAPLYAALRELSSHRRHWWQRWARWDRDSEQRAVRDLRLFIQHVTYLKRWRQLSSERAAELIGRAERIIAALD